MGDCKLTPDQSEHVERLGSFLDAWLSLGVLGPAEMGRTAGKVEDLERLLSALRCGDFKHYNDEGDFSPPGQRRSTIELGRLQEVGTFKDVEADRLKFRGFPDFGPCPFLDATSRSIYMQPFHHALAPGEFEGRVPRVRVHCFREERLKLYRLLDQTNRIKFFSRDEV